MAHQLKEKIESDYFIDTVGASCPVPITKTQEKMLQMKVGETLCVASDDGAVVIDLPAWCISNQQEYLGYYKEDNVIYCYIKKINKMQLERI